MGEITRVIIAVAIFLPLIIGGGDMTRYTRPVPGRSNTYPNAGPYTGDQWAERINIVNVGDERTTRGPYASYLNRLEVTNPAGADFQIDTGAGLCNGHLMINDAAVTITADTPAANPRIDRVVMVYNNTNAAINTTTVGGFTFNVAGGGTDIPAYTCELAIMKGAENAAPALPALEQDVARLWMVELARYQISVVPAITSFTDYRDYVDAETKTVYVPASHAYNNTLASAIYEIDAAWGYAFPDANSCDGDGMYIIPSDYIENGIFYPILDPNQNGNAYIGGAASYGACGEAYNAHTDTDAIGAIAVTTAVYNCVSPITLTVAAPGDIISLFFRRDATDPLDTVNDTITFFGWKFMYLGYRR